MFKYSRSDKGGTLMLVFGFIIMLSFIAVPLAMNTNVGLLQAKTGGNSEAAFAKAHSAMTVFGRLYEDMTEREGISSPNNTEAKIVSLLDQVNAIEALDAEATLVRNSSNEPIEIIFTAKYGNGNQTRSGKVKYKLDAIYVAPVVPPTSTPTPAPTSPPGPTPVPTAPVPNPGGKVLIKANVVGDPYFNKVFAACYVGATAGEALPAKHFNNGFEYTDFEKWFDPTTDYYLNKIDSTTSYAFQNVFPDERMTNVSSISNSTTANELVIEKSRNAINHAGDVRIYKQNGINDAEVIIDKENSKSIVASGNLEFSKEIRNIVVVNGNVQVGKKLTIANSSNSNMTFKGDIHVRGDMQIGTDSDVGEITIEGDLVVGGKLTLNKSIKKLTVNGDIVAGSLSVSSSINVNVNIIGSVVVNGNADFNTINGTSITIGGNFISIGTVQFLGTWNAKFTVMKTMAAAGTISFGTFNSGGSLEVLGDLISKSDILFTGDLNNGVSIGKSLVASGKVQFKVSNAKGTIAIAENLLTKSSLTFTGDLNASIKVGKTIMAIGDVSISTINGNGEMIIGEHFITKSNLSFTSSVNGKVVLENGMLIVYQNAIFGDKLNNVDWNKIKMKGFNVGLKTTFSAEYGNANHTKKYICIT
ncbi:hypothetical protein BK133_28425 [Paenibacillus sp. FSL H8-0548]|uniref:polymer-forming cytoskeletal protein n=1 Tax=Paenibacillus sp. FSL H8-0548 TaxID=1920422 RepID=UPI00096C94F2|nr:polymer-forming cytoskeletal protein [Paenibacillus sp. FSL H8-0548]OMF21443.1 hypothetical protein BK133_28425 [Paenibacillus sp. FSL H8-0548]